jgi:hypothetical protein
MKKKTNELKRWLYAVVRLDGNTIDPCSRRLFDAGYAAALAAVEEQMPERGPGKNPRSQGWNQVVDYMSERIAALRSKVQEGS